MTPTSLNLNGTSEWPWVCPTLQRELQVFRKWGQGCMWNRRRVMTIGRRWMRIKINFASWSVTNTTNNLDHFFINKSGPFIGFMESIPNVFLVGIKEVFQNLIWFHPVFQAIFSGHRIA